MSGVFGFGKLVHQRLNAFGLKTPSLTVIQEICQIIQTASLITEEGRFVQGSITLANPKDPDSIPSIRRADYPSFNAFEACIPFKPKTFGKLARAVDQWSGSIAVWGDSKTSLVIWGIVDQLVGTNASLNREGSGFSNPGMLTIAIDRPGDMTAYHGSIYLGSLRAQEIIRSESEPFGSMILFEKILPAFDPISQVIEKMLSRFTRSAPSSEEIAVFLFREWCSVLSRLCIGLKRFGTGGAFIISSNVADGLLKVGRKFLYERLATSLILESLDSAYSGGMDEDIMEFEDFVPVEFMWEKSFAKTDLVDRRDELTGAIKLVTSLAALDGAVLLDYDLVVQGFGVKINAAETQINVYDGKKYEKRGARAPIVDQSSFGMRHASMLNYCAADPFAIGIVVSQDGHVRLICNDSNRLVMWDQIQLLNHRNFTADVVGAQVSHEKRVRKLAKKRKSLGYSVMPKTVGDLIAGKAN